MTTDFETGMNWANFKQGPEIRGYVFPEVEAFFSTKFWWRILIGCFLNDQFLLFSYWNIIMDANIIIYKYVLQSFFS